MQILVLMLVYTLVVGILYTFLKATAENFSLWLKSHTSKERQRLRDELREELYLEAVKKIYDKEASYLDKISKQSETISNLNIKNQKLEKENREYVFKIKSYLLISDLKLSDLVNNWRFQHEAERIRDGK